MQEETFNQYFETLEKEASKRVANLREMPVQIAEGVARFGEFVRALRLESGYTRRTFASKIGRPRMWVTLLEEGLLHPSEMTEDNLLMLERAFSKASIHCPVLSEVLHAEISDIPRVTDWGVWELKKLPSVN